MSSSSLSSNNMSPDTRLIFQDSQELGNILDGTMEELARKRQKYFDKPIDQRSAGELKEMMDDLSKFVNGMKVQAQVVQELEQSVAADCSSQAPTLTSEFGHSA